MPSILRFLIVENEEPWQKAVRRVLESLEGVRVDVVSSLEAGRDQIEKRAYDLATVDLSLVGRPTSPATADELGLELVEKLLGSERNHQVGVIILTGYSTPARLRTAFRRYRVQDVIEKSSFEPESFLASVKAALLDARLLQVKKRLAERFVLTVSFSQTGWLGSQLRGPGYHSTTYIAERPVRLDAEDLARRADQLNKLILGESLATKGQLWRPEARSIGRAAYQAFRDDPRIASDFDKAQALAKGEPLWLRFSGPPAGLGLPFELLRGDGEPFCFDRVFAREVSDDGSSSVREPMGFHSLLDDLRQRGAALRVLLVGANSNGEIPAVEEEVEYLEEDISIELQRLGLRFEVTSLVGPKASRGAVREALSEGVQILHYAGHGRFEDRLPETSGLILGYGKDTEVLTAAELRQLAADSELCFVFLSCCLGSRTSPSAGRGDFHGTFQALAQSGVANALGYRWTVTDRGALELSKAFYTSLWRTLCPGRALLDTRRSVSTGPNGRDDETWASPILLSHLS
jgi:CheY-like chemotaxis protein